MSGLGPLTTRELKKWYRNPVALVTGLIQPFFWIALFGSALDFTKMLGDAAPLVLEGAKNYITFIVGGVLTITALFTAMFSGTNILFDRRLGPMGRFLSSPIRRSSIVFAKILSGTLRVLPQAVILIVAALIIPNGLVFANGFTILDVLVLLSAMLLVSFIFASLFSVIAIRITRMETIFGIINLVNLPLMFMSNAMFPPGGMANWIANVAKYNPISWSANSMRMVIINGSLTSSQWTQIGQWLGGLAAIALLMMVITYILAEKEIRD